VRAERDWLRGSSKQSNKQPLSQLHNEGSSSEARNFKTLSPQRKKKQPARLLAQPDKQHWQAGTCQAHLDQERAASCRCIVRKHVPAVVPGVRLRSCNLRPPIPFGTGTRRGSASWPVRGAAILTLVAPWRARHPPSSNCPLCRGNHMKPHASVVRGLEPPDSWNRATHCLCCSVVCLWRAKQKGATSVTCCSNTVCKKYHNIASKLPGDW
jgi:hypothetical protein